MSTHIQHPDKPTRTRCGQKIKGLVVFAYGPFGSCPSCRNLYDADQAAGGKS